MGNYVSATKDGLAPFISPDAVDSILCDLTEPDADAAMAEAVDAAEARVDSYLGAKYDVPITSPPATVVKATGALAALHLYERTPSVPTAVSEAADRQVAWLRDVAKGVVVLPGQGTKSVSTTTGVAVFAGEERVMDRDSLSWW